MLGATRIIGIEKNEKRERKKKKKKQRKNTCHFNRSRRFLKEQRQKELSLINSESENNSSL